MTPGQFADQDGGPDMPKPLAAPRMSGLRIACGILWAVLAVGIGAGGVAELTIGNIGGAVVCLVIAALSAWYDYRIWTRKARMLLLFIVVVGDRPRLPRRSPTVRRKGAS